MNHILMRSWWMLALRGLVAIAFGVLAILFPAMTLGSLVALFAAFALLSGAIWVFGAARHRKSDEQWWVLLLLGLASIGAGSVAALHPALTLLVLVLLIGANALVTGVLDIVVAVRMRKKMQGESLLIASGIASIAFGVIVFLFPVGIGGLAIAWMIGLYALVTGMLMLALAWRVRAWMRLGGGRGRPAPV
ncbi:HdeD family acid-resistance protein [Massilia soli]|uniref:DUF308 domain-containing protein n=1 Tax=Massilia soli TaxID=2792854 RepID=A0ABS7SU52_9BURK|nr:DUF308 domain-containing protein [Massilia soli]MBZ2209471.1 DUF308 domain-containing protein [Massilia soli]